MDDEYVFRYTVTDQEFEGVDHFKYTATPGGGPGSGGALGARFLPLGRGVVATDVRDAEEEPSEGSLTAGS